jgi:hypothetical protein
VSITPKLVTAFNIYGIPPKMSCIARLLPRQSDRSFYAGRIDFKFDFVPSPEALQDALRNTVTSLNSVRSEMVKFTDYEKEVQHHVEITSFFRSNVDELDAEFSLSLPSQNVRLGDSTCFTILYHLSSNCVVDELFEYNLVFKQLYCSEFKRSDLVELEQLALSCIFTEEHRRFVNIENEKLLSDHIQHQTVVNPIPGKKVNVNGKRSFSSAIVGKNTIFILDQNGVFLREIPLLHRIGRT